MVTHRHGVPTYPMPAAPVATHTLPPALRDLERQFLAFIRVECGLSANTLAAYGRDLRDLFGELAGRGLTSLGNVSPRDLAKHLADLKTERGLAASSIIRHLATIRVFCRWMLARGMIDENPADILERPTRWRRLPGVLSPKQLKALLEAPAPPADAGPDDAPLWLRDRALLELLYASGLRASEAGAIAL